MSFFKKIGKGIGKLAKSVGKVGKGVFNVAKKVVGTAVGIATPALAGAAGALLPGPLGQGLAGAVSGVGMGLQNMLTPAQAEKISILHSEEGVQAVQNAQVDVRTGQMMPAIATAPIAPAVVEGANTGLAIAQASAMRMPVNGVGAGTEGVGALLKKYFWVPVVCVFAFLALRRK